VSISHHIANLFVSIATLNTFPVVIGVYSHLGFLIPSGGGKWIIEALTSCSGQDLHFHMAGRFRSITRRKACRT